MTDFPFDHIPDTRCHDCRTQCRPNTPEGSADEQNYAVHDEVWTAAAGMGRGWLCIPCLEARLGRPLTGADFPPYQINAPGWHDDTPRLAQLKDEVALLHAGSQP